MDRMTVMKSFVAAGKSESFSSAARSLGVSGSLISRHISDLERQLGVRLVTRTARAISLTEQGQRYFEFSQRLLEQLDRGGLVDPRDPRTRRGRAVDRLAEVDRQPRPVRRDRSVRADHPQINVRFDVGGMADRIYDFIEQGYDLAFHTKHLRDSSVKVRRVATLPFVLCAAPVYLRQRDPDEPLDLAEHNCLVHRKDPVWHFEQGGQRRTTRCQSLGVQLEHLPGPEQGGARGARHRAAAAAPDLR